MRMNESKANKGNEKKKEINKLIRQGKAIGKEGKKSIIKKTTKLEGKEGKTMNR